MGFFSKVWKGVKKTFKKIGKGIKKAFKSFGKFMGKIGILGTIALTLLTGGLGIGGMFGAFGAKLGALGTQLGGVAGGILKGASWTIGKAAQFGSAVKSGFSTLTKGVTEFFGQTAKYVGDKLGFQVSNAPQNFGDVFSRTSEAVSKQFETFKGDVGDLFSTTSPTLEAGKNIAEMNTALKDSGMTIEQATPSYQEDFSPFDTKQTVPEVVAGGGINPFAGAPSPTVDTAAVMSSPVDAGVAQTAESGSFMDSLLKPTKPLEEQTFMERITTPANYGNALATGVTQMPASLATQSLLGAVQDDSLYDVGSTSGYVSQFQSQDYGAVQQGLSRMEDPVWSQQLFDYDAFAQQFGGGYGAYQTYGQKLASFGGN
tara:strand:+ start:234 stop:1349 length:1116 start_codon:yes stop_codon:yes gene_type:complete